MHTNGQLSLDRFAKPVQAFRTDRLQSITSGTKYIPGENDLAFRVPIDTTYFLMDESAVSATLKAGMSTMFNSDLEYTFSTTMVIEIME